jgi:hypothetical protein
MNTLHATSTPPSYEDTLDAQTIAPEPRDLDRALALLPGLPYTTTNGKWTATFAN